MSPPAIWRPLPAPGPNPPLLTSTRFASNSYTIHITDFAHLWTESLDRRSIILRALKEDASIDPSDGEDNMASFLKCLRSAFDPSEPMHRLTSISLCPSSAGDDGLVAAVTCELPKELSSTPLTWRMYLRKQPAEATARELVLPLVEAQRAQKERTEALVEVIRQKDALVSKMLDKLEATGTPLEHVFTALGTRKRVSREQAEARVRGLAPFDSATWEASRGDGGYGGSGGEDVDALVQAVFGAGVGYTPGAGANHYAEGLGAWWRDMGTVSSGPREADDRESTAGKRTAPPSSRESQAISSPARLRSAADDATASETGSEAEDGAPKQSARRLGAIGGARPSLKAPPPDDEETASESDEPQAAHREPPAKKSGLPHRDAPSSAGSATASEDDEAPARPSPVKRGGLGRIGGLARPRREVSEDGEGSEGGKEKTGGEEEKKPERKVLARPVKKKRKF